MDEAEVKELNRMCADLVAEKGYEFAAGFLHAQFQGALAGMSKAKRKQSLAAMRSAMGQCITVKVKSLMNGAEVEIPYDRRGTCSDPSMERYWSM